MYVAHTTHTHEVQPSVVSFPSFFLLPLALFLSLSLSHTLSISLSCSSFFSLDRRRCRRVSAARSELTVLQSKGPSTTENGGDVTISGYSTSCMQWSLTHTHTAEPLLILTHSSGVLAIRCRSRRWWSTPSPPTGQGWGGIASWVS